LYIGVIHGRKRFIALLQKFAEGAELIQNYWQHYRYFSQTFRAIRFTQTTGNSVSVGRTLKSGGWACGRYDGERVLARKLGGQTAVEYLGSDGKMI